MAEIFDINMETNLSEWSSETDTEGDLNWATAAGMAGSAGGMSLYMDGDTTAMYCQHDQSSASTAGKARVRFYVNPKTITMGSDTEHEILDLYNSSWAVIAKVYLYWYASVYYIRLRYYNDAGSGSYSGYHAITTDAEHYCEIYLVKATGAGANNGSAEIWIDSVSKFSVATIDNDVLLASWKYTQGGACGGVDAGTSGTYYLDEFKGNDDGAAIGPLSVVNYKSISGAVTSAGVVTKIDQKPLSGALTSAGVLINSARKVLAGALTSAGALITDLIPGALDLAETLEDNFNDNSIDAGLWEDDAVGGFTLSETNQHIEIVTHVDGGYAELRSANLYNLIGSYAFVQMVDAGNQALESFGITFFIVDDEDDGDDEGLFWQIDNGTISAFVGNDELDSDTYDPDVHKYLRIREASGVIYFDYSSDGFNWTAFASDTPVYSYAASGIGVAVGASLEASSTAAIFDNFNILVGIMSVSGELTSAGGLTKKPSKGLAGAMTSAGALIKQAGKGLAGVLSFTNEDGWYKDTFYVVSGALTPSGVVVKKTARALVGALTSAGVVLKATAKVLSGAVTSAGVLLKTAGKVLAGALESAGELIADFIAGAEEYFQDVGGTLSSAGGLTKLTVRSLAGAVTSAGNLVKVTARSLSGALTSAGGLANRAGKSLSGAMTSAGVLTKGVYKVLGGALTSAGALTRKISKSLAGVLLTTGVLEANAAFIRVVAGVLASAGTLTKSTGKTLGGALTSAGEVTRGFFKTLSGEIIPAGLLTIQTAYARAVDGVLTMSGTVAKAVSRSLAGALAMGGSVVKSVWKVLSGALTGAGVLVSSLRRPTPEKRKHSVQADDRTFVVPRRSG